MRQKFYRMQMRLPHLLRLCLVELTTSTNTECMNKKEYRKKKKLTQLKTDGAPGPVFMKITVNADIVKNYREIVEAETTMRK